MKINKNEFILRRCTKDDLQDILNLQDIVFSQIEDLTHLRKNSYENFLSCLEWPSCILGLFSVTNELIGISILSAVNDKEDNMAIEKELIDKAINVKLTMIKKEYSGNGFQSDMFWIREKIAYKNGFKYLCGSVHPDNHYSVNNFLKNGFTFDHSQKKYGGLNRDIYYKKIDMSSYQENLNRIKNDISVLEMDISNCYFTDDESLLTIGDIIVCYDKNGYTVKHIYDGRSLDEYNERYKMYINPDKNIQKA